MARHYIGAAKPKPAKPRAEIRAAPSFYERTHPVGSAERFLDDAARDALASTAIAAMPAPNLGRFAPGAAREAAIRYPDPLLAEAARLPEEALAESAARAEAYRRAMEARKEAVRVASTALSPVGNMAVNQAGAAAHDAMTRQDWGGGNNTVDRVEFANTTKAERESRRNVLEDARPRIGAPSGTSRPLDERRASLPELLASRLPSGASRDLARMALHGLARTGNTILRAIDIPNRVFGNTRSLLQDIYERSEANLARDTYEDRSGVPQVGETAVHLASAGVLGKALPAVFGANVGADTYETARYAGASEGEALAKGVGHGVVDTAIWTLGQGLASKYLPKAWQWLGRELTGATRGAASSVTSDAVLNSLGADISGEEMAKRAVHAAWMVPLLGMLKMGGKRREEAMSLLRKARPDLAGERADRVIETIEAEFSDPKSQKVALAWVARKGANLPDDTAQIRQALEVSSKVKGLDPMSRSPFEILSDPAYARYLPKPRPQDVKAFSNMKRYPMGVIGFDVSDDAAGRQATREMINAYMSPSSNPWCLATGSGAAKLGELGPGAESYWKQHSAVPKQIFFQEVDGKLELTAFRATSPGGEGRQEYWDTSDAGYSGIPLKVKVPGDPMGRYRKMVFRPTSTAGDGIRVSQGPHPWTYRDEADLERHIEETRSMIARYEAGSANDPYRDIRARSLREDIDAQEQTLRAYREAKSRNNEVQGTFEDIAPGKVFKGDPFRDGRSQTWVKQPPKQVGLTVGSEREIDQAVQEGIVPEHDRERLLEEYRQGDTGILSLTATDPDMPYALIEDKVRTTENGITKFRTTKYADPTHWDYEPPRPGEQPKPVEIEESELVSPEWMRSRGYDPESESDVRRMQQELEIQAWGNGVEAAMAVVPTRRTYMQTKSGTPETVTYGPNGRDDVVSVDFEKDGVPYREEYLRSDNVRGAVPGEFYDPSMPAPQRSGPTSSGFRLIRNPDSPSPEVLNEVKWDEGLGGFVRTSGNRRWRVEPEQHRPVAINDPAGIERLFDRYDEWLESGGDPEPPFRLVIEDRQPDGTWAPAVDRRVNAETGEVVELPPPPPATRTSDTRTEHERMMDEFDRNGGDIPRGLLMSEDEIEAMRNRYDDEMEESYIRHLQGLPELPASQRPHASREPDTALPPEPEPFVDDDDDDIPFALKAGRTRRNVRAAEGGGKPAKWTWETYRWNPEAKGGRLVDPKNIKDTGVTFDERDRAVLPNEKREAFEAWMDELANPKGEWESDDGHKVRVSSRLVPKDWRTNKAYNRDYDYVRAFLLTENNPELRHRLVGPLYHKEDGKYWLHMNDLGKLPTHATFSRGSYYARNSRYADLAGDWEGETYIPGKAERAVHQDTLGGDAGSETAVPETPVSEAPQNPGGPRIVINPQVFEDKRDALCVAFNEAFRVVMEDNGFEPVSEPTEKQRKFFADTAYADDELQLRRTILARIATLDTSVSDPTDEQLEETAEMLEMVMEVGAPQNEWERRSVKRLLGVVSASLNGTKNPGNPVDKRPPDTV